ncbi:MAG: hypothetical protein ACYC90_14835 [Candidatus Nanopelagicales bacterium]
MRTNDSATDLGSEAPLRTGRQAAAWIAFAIEVGIDVDRDGLERIAVAAAANGAPPLLAELACNQHEPMIARLRALGRIATHLG